MQGEIITNKITGDSYKKFHHPSGLDVLVWEMPGFSTTSALFATKYGSINTRFKTKNDADFVDVPDGIAHFLEHKLFENEDCDVFELYAKTGANANAYTTFDHTAYLFDCSENYADSLRILLDFVQKPYFTQATVDKEQGIIGQEIKMCEDSPQRQVLFNLLKTLYKKHPVRIDIAGTVESIAKIDADLLYRCYRTFYNLHNMVLVIAGNCDADEVIKICDEVLIPVEDIGLETDFPAEPMEVEEKYIEQIMPVGLTLFEIGFKVPACKGEKIVKTELESAILLQLIMGSGSPLYKELFDEGLINSQFSSEVFFGEGFFTNLIGGESSDPLEVQRRIYKEIERYKAEGFDEEKFKIIKNSMYGSMIKNLENVESCASTMLSAYILGDLSAFAPIETLSQVTLEDLQNDLDKLFNIDSSAISVVKAR
ncbi:MAG: insulinase family protein [Ruminococcus sp.]|nr:insulinase family protein [Ruminococcus sp.]